MPFCVCPSQTNGIYSSNLRWNFRFPTYAERVAWTVLCLIAVGMVCIFSVVQIMCTWARNRLRQNKQTAFVEAFHDYPRLRDFEIFIKQTTLPIYIFARVGIMALIFLSLRALPEDSYTAVDWVTSIPHF